MKLVKTKHGNIAIRPYQRTDELAVIDAWEKAFKKPLDKTLWQWKYYGPFQHQLMIGRVENTQAQDCQSGDVVSLYGGVPYPSLWNQKQIKMTHLMDNFSHPAYRGSIGGRKGLFVQTVNEFFDTYGGSHSSIYLYGFPGYRHSKLGEKLLHYKGLPNNHYFKYDFNSDTALIHQSKNNFTASLLNHIQKRETFNQQFTRLFQSKAKIMPLTIIRDETFLTWRFTQHPNKTYETWVYQNRITKKITAYVVLYFPSKGVAQIADILLPENTKQSEFFLRWLLFMLQERNMEKLEIWNANTPNLLASLTNVGFIKHKEPLGILPTARTFEKNLDWQWAANNLYYTMADGDLI